MITGSARVTLDASLNTFRRISTSFLYPNPCATRDDDALRFTRADLEPGHGGAPGLPPRSLAPPHRTCFVKQRPSSAASIEPCMGYSNQGRAPRAVLGPFVSCHFKDNGTNWSTSRKENNYQFFIKLKLAVGWCDSSLT